MLAQLGQEATLDVATDSASEGDSSQVDTSRFMQAQFANYIIFGSAILALVYALYCFVQVNKINMTKEVVRVQNADDNELITSGQDKAGPPKTQEEAFNMMLKVSELIKNGANEFLRKEYTYLAVFCFFFSLLIYFAVDFPVSSGYTRYLPYTTVAFYIGVLTSMASGYIGMRVAVHTNVRTTWCCNMSI